MTRAPTQHTEERERGGWGHDVGRQKGRSRWAQDSHVTRGGRRRCSTILRTRVHGRTAYGHIRIVIGEWWSLWLVWHKGILRRGYYDECCVYEYGVYECTPYGVCTRTHVRSTPCSPRRLRACKRRDEGCVLVRSTSSQVLRTRTEYCVLRTALQKRQPGCLAGRRGWQGWIHATYW